MRKQKASQKPQLTIEDLDRIAQETIDNRLETQVKEAWDRMVPEYMAFCNQYNYKPITKQCEYDTDRWLRFAAFLKETDGNGADAIRSKFYAVKNMLKKHKVYLDIKRSSFGEFHNFLDGRRKEKPAKPKHNMTSKMIAVAFDKRQFSTDKDKYNLSDEELYKNQVKRSVMTSQLIAQARSNKFTAKKINGLKINSLRFKDGSYTPRQKDLLHCPKSFLIVTNHGKGNYSGKEQFVVIYCTCKTEKWCAVKELIKMYIFRKGDWKPNDPIWVYLTRNGQREVKYDDMRNWTKDIAILNDKDPRCYGTHSNRGGGVAINKRHGFTDQDVQIQGQWRSKKMAAMYAQKAAAEQMQKIIELRIKKTLKMKRKWKRNRNKRKRKVT